MSKFKLSDLLPQTYKFKPTHPVHGELDFEIEVRSFTPEMRKEFLEAGAILRQAEAVANTDAIKYADLMNRSAELIGSIASKSVCGWDEEVFGPFSPERAREVMLDENFNWLASQVFGNVVNQTNFFRKPGKAAGKKS